MAEETGHDAGKEAACRILLVEDDAPVRERLARIIAAWPGGLLPRVMACLFGHLRRSPPVGTYPTS